MTPVKAKDVVIDDFLYNIGTVSKVEHFPEAKKVSIQVKETIILSATFFWFEESQFLIRKN